MLIKVTNKGPARTVDFLAVFAEGETKEFDQAALDSYQALSGVKVFHSELLDEDKFDVVVISEEGN
jgi:hypothetical protein